jgi:hypothetical protein
LTSRQPRHGPNDFYGSAGPPTPSGGAWPPPPLWRPPVSPMPARQGSTGAPGTSGSGDGAWPEGHAPKPRWSVRHLVGYPATALLALAVGAAPSDGAATAVAPAASPTVTVTAPARTATVTAPATTVTVTEAAAGASPSGGGSAYFTSCSAAWAAGDAPLSADEPGYRPALDRDKDGLACE